MTEHEGWQVSGDAAEVYEKCFVPAIFGRWAPQILTQIARRECGQAAADVLTAPFALGDEDALRVLFQEAGVDEPNIQLRNGTIAFPRIEVFVETEVKGSPLERLLDEESYQGLMQEARERLHQFCIDGGEVVMPMDAFIITAGKA
jgi:hypothetical protein